MKKIKRSPVPAQELPDTEIPGLLKEIGSHIKTRRQMLTTQERFSVETNISVTALSKQESGGDMRLSSLLKLCYGFDVKLSEFFREMDM